MRAWNPKFILLDNTYEAADEINKPHEDYPGRVRVTKEMIDIVIAKYDSALLESDIKAIHSEIMWDLSERGMWRPYNVFIGDHVPPDHLKIQEEIDTADLFPVVRGFHDPIRWYYDFETIHPFVDGNGRVGGVVLVWLTYDPKTNTMLSPWST